jgi:hypothetical protein
MGRFVLDWASTLTVLRGIILMVVYSWLFSPRIVIFILLAVAIVDPQKVMFFPSPNKILHFSEVESKTKNYFPENPVKSKSCKPGRPSAQCGNLALRTLSLLTIATRSPTMPAMSKKTKIASARREYASLNSLYHKVGKKAFGKPASSAVKKDYRKVKAERNRAGAILGRLTGRKPRRK